MRTESNNDCSLWGAVSMILFGRRMPHHCTTIKFDLPMCIVEMCSRDHDVEAFVYFTDPLLTDNEYLKMDRLNQRRRPALSTF